MNLERENRQEGWYLLIPCITALLFILISNHVWEDYLITFRFSRNLADGNGLVYQIGERVHGFTSFFNTMIPALFDWLYQGRSIYPALWGYRLVSIGVFASACLLLARTWRALGVKESWILGGVVLVSLDVKMVAFSTNGQEVAFMLFFIAFAFRIISQGLAGSAWKIGLCGAGFMYTRPDGCLYAGVIFGLAVLLSRESRLKALKSVISGGLLTVLLYLPWLLFVWCYYGSPVPNTIVAKVGAYSDLSQTISIVSIFSVLPKLILSLYNPVYESSYFEPYSVAFFSWVILATLIIGVFSARPRTPIVQISVCAFFLMVCYLAYGYLRVGMVFPWYKPAVCFLGYIAWIPLASSFGERTQGKTRKLVSGVGLMVLAIALLSYVAGVIQLSSHQRIVENGVRKATGLWLAEHANPCDKVHSEPIGYIGFYSGLHILDWPGLQSPEVVVLRHRFNNDRAKVLQELMPDWIVLRPMEMLYINQQVELNQAYEIAVVFDQTGKLDELSWLPGNRYHYADAKYFVLRKIRDNILSR